MNFDITVGRFIEWSAAKRDHCRIDAQVGSLSWESTTIADLPLSNSLASILIEW